MSEVKRTTDQSRQEQQTRARFFERRERLDRQMRGATERLSDVNRRIVAWDARDFEDGSELYSACRALGHYLGVHVAAPASDAADESRTMLDSILQLSDIRHRSVTLGSGWWRRHSGAMIATLRDGTPVALLPRGLSSYNLYNPRTDRTVRVDAKLAAEVQPRATAAYRAFPNAKMGLRQMARFVLGEHIYIEILFILLFSFIASLIQVLPPIVSGQIFDTIVPESQRRMLVQVILILLAFQISGMGFSVIVNLGFSRIKSKLDLALQAAVWDRLLGQKLQFFYRYTTGELLEKVKGLNQINSALSMDLLKTLLASVFAFVNVIVMYRYSPGITGNVLLLFLALFAVTALVAREKLRLGNKLMRVGNRATSLNQQLVRGVERVKASRAEERAYALWSAYEAETRYLQGRINLYTTALDAFYAFFSLASVALTYLWISREASASMGVFVAYISTFLIFQAAMMGLMGAVNTILGVVPAWRNLQPILSSPPERTSRRATPKDVDGSIELNHVSFGYEEFGRTILHDVSFRIEKGESVGIVGLSGSGKSTLMKLMLGLHEPTGGKIYFGGYDLSTVDLTYLRHLLGVVLQNAELPPGTVFSIVSGGDDSVSADDALRALESVGLKDQVNALDNGIYTLLGTGNSQLDAGARQKLLVAHAICRRRKYILFDEATSALDNAAQSIVMQALGQLDATKVIVAQRLATVEHCDRIIVIENGKLLAEGSYDEIVRQRHLFGASVDSHEDQAD